MLTVTMLVNVLHGAALRSSEPIEPGTTRIREKYTRMARAVRGEVAAALVPLDLHDDTRDPFDDGYRQALADVRHALSLDAASRAIREGGDGA